MNLNFKKLIKVISMIFIFIFVLMYKIPNCYAIFKHTDNITLKIKSEGKAPTCSLSNTNIVNTGLNINFSNADYSEYKIQYKTPDIADFQNAPLDENGNGYLSVSNNVDIEMRYIDGIGNTSAVAICSVTNIDKIFPTLSFNPNNDGVWKKEKTVAINSTDNIGINKVLYKISTSSTEEPTGTWTEVSGNNETGVNTSALLEDITGTYYIWAKSIDIAGNVKTEVSEAFLLDNTTPEISIEDTSANDSNISISVTSSDLHSDVKGYYYSIDNGTTWSTIQSSGFYMFAGLENDTTYNIRVKAEDNAGNFAVSDPVTVTTAPFGNITVSVDSDEWSTSKTATVAFENTSGYTYRFSTDSGNSWIEITTTSQVTYNHNGKFMVKVSGNDTEKVYEYKVKKIDPIPVTINSITAPADSITSESFNVVVNAIDTGSDEERSEISGYKYSLDGTTWTELQTSNEHTFSDLIDDTEYNVYVRVYDNAGNVTNSTTTVKTNVLNNIFLDGINGNDNDDGLSPITAVKTFAKAKTLLEKGGTIWLCGQVTINSEESWDLAGYGKDDDRGVIKRWDGTSVPFTEAGNKVAFTTRAIAVNAGKKLSLSNLIMDGNKDNVVGAAGSSMLIQTSGDVDIDNCIFRNHKSPTGGLIVNIRWNGNPIVSIKNSVISGNEAIDSGASNGTISFDRGSLIIDNTIFDNNSNVRGGVIVSAFKSGIYNRTINITNSTFSNNSGDKGGISIDRFDNTTIKNTIFSNNTSINHTIYLSGESNLTLEDCTLSNNSAPNGGAIYVRTDTSTLNLKNTTFTGNSATNRGGAIYMYNGTLNIDSVDINNNSSVGLGAGIYLSAGTINMKGTVNIINNVNSAQDGDLYLPNGKFVNINGDLVSSNIGIYTTQNPTASVPVDIAIPVAGYTMPNTYFNQFIPNRIIYETGNSVYDTTNNKVILKRP